MSGPRSFARLRFGGKHSRADRLCVASPSRNSWGRHMKTTGSIGLLLLLAWIRTSGPLEAQSVPWLIPSTFSFAPSVAVASDPTADVIYMGAGSGYIALNGSANGPVPLSGTQLTDYRARCRGFVRDIK